MAIPVQMPKMGISVESCVLTKWHKKSGDTVKKGDLLFTYETDKTTVDEESPADGVLLAVFFNEGDDVPVMQNVAVIGKQGENFSDFAPGKEREINANEGEKLTAGTNNVKSESTENIKAAEHNADAAQPSNQSKLNISPRARILVQKTGVDPSRAAATGAEGRIIESDIAALAATTAPSVSSEAALGISGTGIGGRLRAEDKLPAQPEKSDAIPKKPSSDVGYQDEKLTSVRKYIAKAMHESLSTMAQLTNNMSFDATNILSFRRELKEKGGKSGLDGITINDIILYAVSRVLTKHKIINAHFYGDFIRHFDSAHLGVAVDTPRGLLVPTLFNADKMSLNAISAASKQLISASQAGTIAPDLLKGGTFTVTNLGALGVESFTPIINPPQTCILGVNTIKDAVRIDNGEIKVYKSMTLSLTYDHRAVDGAPASRFLKDVCEALENFTLTLAI